MFHSVLQLANFVSVPESSEIIKAFSQKTGLMRPVRVNTEQKDAKTCFLKLSGAEEFGAKSL